MKKNFLVVTLVTCFLFATCLVSSAASLVINAPNAAPVLNVDSMSSWQTTGNVMDGMRVTVTYADDTIGTALWNDNTGAVSADGWSLGLTSFTENTFYQTQWLFDVTDASLEVKSFTIEAVVGNTVFDLDTKNTKTPGSEIGGEVDIINYGRSWEVSTSFNGPIGVTYSGQVHLQNIWYEDLYQNLTIDFGSNYFDKDDVLAFYADTDNLRDPVPEPAAIVLFGLGAVMLAGRRVKRKR